jgi:phospholipase/carboxylesterase
VSAPTNPHLAIAPVLVGAPLERARLVAVLVHGRDQNEQVMLDAVQRLALSDVSYTLPVAAGNSWYPNRYYDPVSENEPHLGWALAAIEAAIDAVNHSGVPDSRILVGGFSQGACLIAELTARVARPFVGVAILTGSLFGPPRERRTPVPASGLQMYCASSRHDEWVALEDAEATAAAFERAGANVVFETLDDREHLISDRAIAGLRTLLVNPGPLSRPR